MKREDVVIQLLEAESKRLRKRRRGRRRRQLQDNVSSFSLGAAQSIDLTGTLALEQLQRILEHEAKQDSIYEDWRSVGGDLRKALAAWAESVRAELATM